VHEFSQGLAPVRIGEKWGFLNHSGTFVVEPKYQSAKPFFDSRALVKINGKYGYIDQSGEMVIPAKYWLSGSLSNGRALIVLPNHSEQTITTGDE
jgi:WG containing repeat